MDMTVFPSWVPEAPNSFNQAIRQKSLLSIITSVGTCASCSIEISAGLNNMRASWIPW